MLLVSRHFIFVSKSMSFAGTLCKHQDYEDDQRGQESSLLTIRVE